MKERKVFDPIGALEQFLPQIGRTVNWNGWEIAVFRTSAGEVFALENRSPHPKGGPLAEGMVSGCFLYEPLHDWKIDLRTGLVQLPDQGQVLSFPVKVEGDQVYIAAPDVHPAST
ncbi:nitrite reductase (NAD(P)H) small subunit [Paenibacillus spongiae]|uniref:Nitrite reductase (NAD(P)H) small subunit n=1 Tax=Paenibacillus spongiae TaxID=2909671 RepID=A0ABY5SFP2_9BACL|nr:nitrite reductase (NAD(P)H) small subunit [Paenibacillus spongiae]UVI32796.1 nitrite reductase (NAD(P)H) small subunit [Paenibacillus spongiae]